MRPWTIGSNFHLRDWRGAAAKQISTFSFLDPDLEGWSLEHSTPDPLPLPDPFAHQLTHIVEHGLGQNPSQDGNAASPIDSVRQRPHLLALAEESSMILEKAIIYKRRTVFLQAVGVKQEMQGLLLRLCLAAVLSLDLLKFFLEGQDFLPTSGINIAAVCELAGFVFWDTRIDTDVVLLELDLD